MEPIETINYKGYKIEIYPDENDYTFPYDDLKKNDKVFLVNYHSDFEVRRDEIITEDEVEAWYQGEKIPQEKNFWIWQLSMLSHSGVWLKLGKQGFMADPGGWDTSHVGIVLVNKKEAKTRKKAEKLAEALVDQYNDLLSGNVYGYIVRDEFENEIGSCYGFIGNLEKTGMIEDAKKQIDDYIKNDLPRIKKEREAAEFLKRHEVNLLTLSRHQDERIVRCSKSLIKLLNIR